MCARHWQSRPCQCRLKKLTREAHRLGSTASRLKLKGIDGDPHKRWNMWFNSTINEKPYQGLNSESVGCLNRSPTVKSDSHRGVAWLSSARGVSCSLQW